MGTRRGHVLLILAGLLTGCGSGRALHGGKLGPRVGVQAGYLQPLGGGGQDFNGGPCGGVVVRIGADLAKPLGLELGAAYSEVTAKETDAKAYFYLLRARALFVGARGRGLSIGMQQIEQHAYEYGKWQDEYVGWAIDFGLVQCFWGRYELGVNYAWLMESENVTGTVEATFGINYAF